MNNVLNSVIRPTVLFDSANAEHRFWAHQFIKRRSWHGCPWVFALPRCEDNVYNMVIRMLAEYYTEKEFSVVEKPHGEKVVAMKQRPYG